MNREGAYIVTFDFPSMKMYLQKGRAFAEPDEANMSGLHILRMDDLTLVHSVDPASPALRAGLAPQDVILKVGEQSMTTMDLLDLRHLLTSGDGKQIKLTIKRGQEEKVVTLTLKKQI